MTTETGQHSGEHFLQATFLRSQVQNMGDFVMDRRVKDMVQGL